MEGRSYIQKAYTAILRGDFEQALACFEEAVRLEPDNAGYRMKLSMSYARSERWQAAVQHAEAAVRLEPDHAGYREHLRRIRSNERLHAAREWLDGSRLRAYTAVALLKQATELDPLNAGALYLLAYACRMTGDDGAALSALNELFKLDAQHEDGLRLREEIRQSWHQEWKNRKGKPGNE